ncbi:hypothetical protein FOA43_002008 [Brettanomyces nanus]|uniref:Phosphoinositide phospholipase C n=1 Tax=Eeniella nana TaxID=13502 RepID=A0A875RZT4_EENNA|nr:uncharacterized protein FOA43_002008 [Brettanomyces nanus]QPG74676.1 hypothetical protein FOA43_002008 [Brettanomyces nanus]
MPIVRPNSNENSVPMPRVGSDSKEGNNSPVKQLLYKRLSFLRNKKTSGTVIGNILVSTSSSYDSSVTLATSGSYDSTNDSSNSGDSSEDVNNDSSADEVSRSMVHGFSSALAVISLPLTRSVVYTSSDSLGFPDEYFSRPLDRKNIPVEFLEPGFEMLRVTHRKKVKRFFRLDLEQSRLYWNSKASSFLEIEKIKSIRIGDEAKNYREEFKVSSQYCDFWITVIYHNYAKSNNIKALHIIATSKRDYDQFLYTLSNLVYFRRQLQSSLYSAACSNLFTKFHWNNKSSGMDRLDFEGVLKMATRLHIYVDRDFLLKIFKTEDRGGKEYLDFDEFKRFVKTLRQRHEFASIFSTFSDSQQRMRKHSFERFLVEEQQEPVDGDDTVTHLFSKFSKGKDYLSLDEFGSFLVSPYTMTFKTVVEDFSKPLNEYFISSSHNTYLLGRQFNGVSSIEGYIRALQRGCRCIEVDVWDGENGPIVTHGRTFTGSMDFRLVIETIRKYSFITSPFPVIISLEIRCNQANQIACVCILKEILQDMLLPVRLGSLNPDSLPSPLDLKHKILVKVKRSKSVSVANGILPSSTSSSFSEDSTSTSKITKIIPKPKKPVPIVPELGALALYTIGVKFRNFSLPESKTLNHCFSFSDRTISKMLKEKTKFNAITKHNRNFLMRVYPSVYRFKSDNFNPLTLWSLGCQIAATNWQVYDAGQQINEALFNVGSCSGYILKPEALRTNKERFRKTEDFESVLRFDKTSTLEVGIVSAQQLSKTKDMKVNSFDVYIEVELYSGKVIDFDARKGEGVHSTTIGEPQIKTGSDNTNSNPCQHFDTQQIMDLGVPSAVFRTSIALKNGFNPIWNEYFRLSFHTNQENLTFLRFLVKCNTPDHKDVLIGSHCCKLDYMKKGYRHLPVYDLQGEELIYSSLFLHIN